MLTIRYETLFHSTQILCTLNYGWMNLRIGWMEGIYRMDGGREDIIITNNIIIVTKIMLWEWA